MLTAKPRNDKVLPLDEETRVLVNSPKKSSSSSSSKKGESLKKGSSSSKQKNKVSVLKPIPETNPSSIAAAVKIQSAFRCRIAQLEYRIICLQNKFKKIKFDGKEQTWTINLYAQESKDRFNRKIFTLLCSNPKLLRLKDDGKKKIETSFTKIDKIKQLNDKYQKRKVKLTDEYNKLQIENKRLEKANVISKNCLHKLKQHITYLESKNQIALNHTTKCQTEINQLRDICDNRRQVQAKEEKLKTIYQKYVIQMVQIMKEKYKDTDLVEQIFILACTCKKQVDDKKKLLVNPNPVKMVPLYVLLESDENKYSRNIEDDDVSSVSCSLYEK